MKIVNIKKENLHIFWTIFVISMKLVTYVVLKVTKK